MAYNFDNYWWFELREPGCLTTVMGPYLTEAEANKTYKSYMERIKGRI